MGGKHSKNENKPYGPFTYKISESKTFSDNIPYLQNEELAIINYSTSEGETYNLSKKIFSNFKIPYKKTVNPGNFLYKNSKLYSFSVFSTEGNDTQNFEMEMKPVNQVQFRLLPKNPKKDDFKSAGLVFAGNDYIIRCGQNLCDVFCIAEN